MEYKIGNNYLFVDQRQAHIFFKTCSCIWKNQTWLLSFRVFILLNVVGSNSTLYAAKTTENIENVKIELFEWLDSSKKNTIDSAIADKSNKHFSKLNSTTPTYGAISSSLWLKIVIYNKGTKKKILLDIAYPLLNYLEFYHVDSGKIINSIRTGDKRPFEKRQKIHRNFVFTLPLKASGESMFFIRIDNEGEPLRVPMNFMSYKDFLNRYNLQTIILGLFYGLVLFAIIFHFFLFVILKERIYIYYTLYLIFLFLFILNIDGVSYQHLWSNCPWFNNLSTILFTNLAVLFLVQFSKSFLKTWKFSPRLNRILNILQILGIVIIALTFTNNPFYRFAVLLTNFYALSAIIIIIISAFSSLNKKNKGAYFFLISYFLFMITIIAYVFRNIGFINDTQNITDLLRLGFTSQILFLTFAITDRYKRLKEKANSELEYLVRLRTEEINSQSEEIRAQTEQLTLVNKELEMLSIAASETENGITIFAEDGSIEWQNRGFKNIFGYSYRDKLYYKEANIFELNENENFNYHLSRALQLKKPVTFHTECKNRNGKNLYLQTTLNPIIEDKKIIKIIAIDSDISEIKINENTLIKKNKDILASIKTAMRIQSALLPPNHQIKKIFPQSFVLYKPKDLVSGDFYWLGRRDHNILFAAADCTGHGIPGAFMSIIGFYLLNQAVKEERLSSLSEILVSIDKSITKNLKKSLNYDSLNEGMDIMLCSYNIENGKLTFAGAHSSLYIIKNDILYEYKGDRTTLGLFYENKKNAFTINEIQMHKGDKIYMFSDGYADQFGGTERKKYMRKNFKEFILQIHSLNEQEQKSKLEEEFERWKGVHEQIDDILIWGIQL